MGRTNININICKLENLNESENSKFYSLQNFLLEVFGKENEKIELDHTNTGEYYFYIYIKDTNINKEYKIEKIESIFFEKKGREKIVDDIMISLPYEDILENDKDIFEEIKEIMELKDKIDKLFFNL